MPVIIDDFELDFDWSDDATGGNYFASRDTARERVDLTLVLEHYAKRTATPSDDGSGYKAACFLPSRVDGFAGTCAEQDANAGQPGQHLSVTRSEDGTHWRWRCFSCGRGQTRDGSRPGDVVDLVTHAEGFPINEGNSGSLRGLRHTLRLAGLDHVLDGKAAPTAPRRGDTFARPEFSVLVEGEAPAKREVNVPLDTAIKLNRQACDHFVAALNSNDGLAARAYLKARGVTPEQVKRYRLGFARDEFQALAKNLANASAAQALGLARLYPGVGKVGDAYRCRVMFPYAYAARGDRPAGVYGFAGRNLKGVDPRTGENVLGFAHYNDKPPPKWTNSKNVEGVYHKTHRKNAADLVGVWQALAGVRKTGRACVCEGGFDMLALDRAGVPALALVGKEVSLGHALTVRSLPGARRVTYATDGEPGGRAAVVKFAAAMLSVGFALDVLDVLDADDGDDPATTPLAVLRERWAEPVPVLAFVDRLFAADPSLNVGPLLSAAPYLAERFGRAPSAQSSAGTGDAIVVRSLIDAPGLAQHLNRNEAREVLCDCPSWPAVEAFAFTDGESSPEALPKDMRRAWLRERYTWLCKAVAAIEATPRPTDRAAMLDYFARGDTLRKARRVIEAQLIAVNKLFC